MRKVLPCLIGFSAVVSPTIMPSWTDQKVGSPSQPVRSLPLKRDLKPSSLSDGLRSSAATSARREKRQSAGMSWFFMGLRWWNWVSLEVLVYSKGVEWEKCNDRWQTRKE